MIYSLTVTNSIGESMTLELSNPWASGYAIKNIDGLGTPDMNVNTTPYGIGDGSVLGSIKAEYRIITIQLYPLALPTVESARQKLYRFFQIKKEIVLTFNTENRLVTIEGYVQKIEPNIFENPESITIEVKCINPYFHKMMKDQTKFYGIEPMFEFVFSNEFEIGEAEDDGSIGSAETDLFYELYDIDFVGDAEKVITIHFQQTTDLYQIGVNRRTTMAYILDDLQTSPVTMEEITFRYDPVKREILSVRNGMAAPVWYENRVDKSTIEKRPPKPVPIYLDPIEFSQFTIDNRMTIEYEGEIDAGIRITIECQTPPGDIIIYNVDTLEYIQIFAERVEAASGAPLGPKDIIEISTESGNKYVRLLRNGIYYNVLGAMNRGMTWFVLKQGPNTFTYTTTDEHAAISMTFSYRDAYAAI